MRDTTLIIDSTAQVPAVTPKRLAVALVRDDTPQHADVARTLSADKRLALVQASSRAELAALLSGDKVELVVTELAPFSDDRLEVLELAHKLGSRAQVVFVTGRGDEHWAVEAMKHGAADYLAKMPGYLDDLPTRLITAARRLGARGLNGASRNGNGNGAKPAAPSADASVYYTRLLNALPVHMALVDERGVIRAANRAWKMAAFGSDYQNASLVEGVDYLQVCDRAAGTTKVTGGLADGLRGVLQQRLPAHTAEYSCMLEDQQRWFKVAISPVRNEAYQGAIIAHVDITDRKQAELERDQLFERSMSMLCIGGFDGYIKRWSPAFQRFLGHTLEEMMVAPVWEFLHPEDRVHAADMGRQLVSGETVSSVEMRVRAKDGTYKWILWDAAPCVEQKLFFATGQDITVRKQIERQLQESHQRFDLIAGATKEAIWDWDLRKNHLWQNEGYIQSFGEPDLSRETVVEWWRRRIHPLDLERILECLPPKLIDGQQKWVLEYRLRRVDGSYAYVYDRGFVVFDEQGQPARMVGSIIDISELKQTEQRLRESEERFQLAAKATRDAIWDWDMVSNQVWRSNGFENLFGYRLDEMSSGLDWWGARIHPDDRERVMAEIPSLDSATPQQWACEYRFQRADGTFADVLDRGFVMFDHEGKPGRMIGTIMDMSARRHAEELVQMHQAELAHIARVSTMGEIATGIAHELNQPLTAISNYAESCVQALTAKKSNGKPSTTDERLAGWIERISNNTHRAAEMIRRLRSFTRKSEPRRSTVELGEMVREVIELLETETRRQHARIRWKRGRQVHLTVDRIQVQQVLVNLIRNAYEAMAGRDEHDRQVIISARALGGKMQVSVEDAGEGIAPEDLERVFEAFFTSKPNGVGIGLAISRSIVEDHGGRLWATRNPTQGVTFHFTLPMSGA